MASSILFAKFDYPVAHQNVNSLFSYCAWLWNHILDIEL